MENIFVWAFYFMTFYAFIPGFLSRVFGYRVFKKGLAHKELALTFDDGPDPQYTAQLLDLLKKHDAKATFFVVGVNAKQSPELIKRMRDEGHTIGVHNYEHKTNWFMRPKTVKRHIELTNDIIFEVTGHYSSYYRPPWGIINIFDFRRVSTLKIVLWSAIFGDWQKKLSADKLKQKMLKKLKPGEIFLLHDSGRTFGADETAPENMLIALEEVLKVAGEKGYSFVTIDELQALTEQNKQTEPSHVKRGLIKAWLLYEDIFHKVLKIKTVHSRSSNTFFHYRYTTYTGSIMTLQNGDTVQKGDQILELHFDNKMLSSIAYESKSTLAIAVKLIRETEKNLPFLAKQLVEDNKLDQIKAVYGVSMINRGADRLGFELKDLDEGIFLWASKKYLKLLMKVLTPKRNSKTSAREAQAKNEMVPRALFMSRDVLLSYLEETSREYTKKEVAVTVSQ